MQWDYHGKSYLTKDKRHCSIETSLKSLLSTSQDIIPQILQVPFPTLKTKCFHVGNSTLTFRYCNLIFISNAFLLIIACVHGLGPIPSGIRNIITPGGTQATM